MPTKQAPWLPFEVPKLELDRRPRKIRQNTEGLGERVAKRNYKLQIFRSSRASITNPNTDDSRHWG
jgi:hypothetical protein